MDSSKSAKSNLKTKSILPKTNGWRAPKWWALEKVTGPFKKWQLLVSMLDFWGAYLVVGFIFVTNSVIHPHKHVTNLNNVPGSPLAIPWVNDFAAAEYPATVCEFTTSQLLPYTYLYLYTLFILSGNFRMFYDYLLSDEKSWKGV